MTENGVRFFVHPCRNLKKMPSDGGCSQGRYNREETRAFITKRRANERSTEVGVRIHLMLGRALQLRAKAGSIPPSRRSEYT